MQRKKVLTSFISCHYPIICEKNATVEFDGLWYCEEHAYCVKRNREYLKFGFMSQATKSSISLR
jgi:hypothetical protein